ncbi:MAG: hypothetical protein Kow00128_01810 [Deltaproteobacteria bacterium]
MSAGRGDIRFRPGPAIDWPRVLDALPDAVSVIDPDHRFLWVNDAMARFLGMPAKEVLGRRCFELVHCATERIDRCPCARLAGKRETEEMEIPERGIRVRITVDPIRNADGTFFGAIHLITEITREKREEEKHRELSGRLASLMNNVPGAVYRGLRDWSIQLMGAEVERLTGYTQREVTEGTVNWRTLVHPGDLEWLREVFRQAVREGKRILQVEYRILHRDGSVRWVADRRQIFYDEAGEFSYVDGLLLDITERKAMEEALLRSEEKFRQSQKMEAIGRLAGGIAHDFNNLLTAIRGYSDLLLQAMGEGDPHRREVAEIRKAGERAASLTQQLLAFSRKQILEPKVLDLNGIVADMERMLRRMIGEDVDLVTVLRPGLWAVKADPGQIEQVILNLAVNARDAMPEGGTLSIETVNRRVDRAGTGECPDAEPGEYVMLAVGDTGHGMDEQTLSRIFEPFFTTKEKGKGTGLGLATVYGIVKQSGGFIYPESRPGEGTVFRIYLPRCMEIPAPPADREPKRGETPRGKETILLVEDDEVVRTLAEAILAGSGYTVLCAPDGRDGVEAAERHEGPIHLLLTDVVMPKMGGRDLAKEIASRRAGLKVLFMTGYAADAFLEERNLPPGSKILRKPFRVDGLLRKVREILDE